MAESPELAQAIGSELQNRLTRPNDGAADCSNHSPHSPHSSNDGRCRLPFSFLCYENTVFYHQYSRRNYEPSSSILRLIQGIYETAPQKARQILRSRIYSNENPTELCYGAVKVSAKRLTASLDFRPSLREPCSSTCTSLHSSPYSSPYSSVKTSIIPENFQWVEVGQKIERFSDHRFLAPPFWTPPFLAAPSESDFLKLAGDLAATSLKNSSLETPRYLRDRPIAAILVSEKNEILSWAVNTNASNRTLHAELNLVQEHFCRTGKPLPRGAKIFVTLKPCKMCAGAIWVSSEDPFSTQVFYSEFDPGRNARWTVLDPGSSERRRVNISTNPPLQTSINL